MNKFEALFHYNKKVISFASYPLFILNYKRYKNVKSQLVRNDELRLKKSTNKCFICGLGPSLKHVDFSKIDCDTIVVNNFVQFGKNINFIPNFYIASDDEFALDENINKIKSAIQKYPDCSFVLGDKIYSRLKKDNGISPNIYVSFGGNLLFNNQLNIDFTKRLPVSMNILSEAIMLAIYIGYKEIYLLGADFNSFASQKAVHCYEEKDDNRKFSMGFELFCYSFAADVHKELAEYSKINDICIFNATPGSLIDAYERVGLAIY